MGWNNSGMRADFVLSPYGKLDRRNRELHFPCLTVSVEHALISRIPSWIFQSSNLMTRNLSLLLLLSAAVGCASIRSTIRLTEAEQALYQARQYDPQDSAVYEWTLAELYMVKSREEWGYSDYEAAEMFAEKAAKWAAEAEEMASREETFEALDEAQEIVPVEAAPVDPLEDERPEIQSEYETLEFDEGLDED